MCVENCPTLGERVSDLSSYNISTSSDPRSGIVWMVSFCFPLPVPQPSEGWVMWVMESNRVHIVSVRVTLLYLVSAGSEVTHGTYLSWPCPTHLGLSWVYPTLINGACQWAGLPNRLDRCLRVLFGCLCPPPPQPWAVRPPLWPFAPTHICSAQYSPFALALHMWWWNDDLTCIWLSLLFYGRPLCIFTFFGCFHLFFMLQPQTSVNTL